MEWREIGYAARKRGSLAAKLETARSPVYFISDSRDSIPLPGPFYPSCTGLIAGIDELEQSLLSRPSVFFYFLLIDFLHSDTP